MAYELFNKIPHGIPSDIYSLGVFMYEVFTKARPFVDATNGAAIKPDALVNKIANLSADGKALLTKALQREAKDRYQTTQEMMADPWFAGNDRHISIM
jgi:serine/threonine protein kinase